MSKNVPFTVVSGQTVDIGIVELNNEKGNAVGSIEANNLDSLANIVVYARGADGSIYTTLTGTNGHYRFNALPVGKGYSFIAQANDFNSSKQDNVDILQGETSSINLITLSKSVIVENITTGSITGAAKFSEYKTVLNQHAGIIVSIEGSDKEAITSRDGSYIFNNIETGYYNLNFTDSNHQAVTLQNVKVGTATTTNLDIQILQGLTGSVSGVVINNAGFPIVGVIITDEQSGVSTITNDQGEFTLTDLIIGEHQLKISQEGSITTNLLVTVEQGQNKILTDNIELASYSFRGTISLGDEVEDHSNIQVSLVGSSNLTVFTNEDGLFSFQGASPGNYQVTLVKSGYQTKSLSIQIPEQADYVLPYIVDLAVQVGVIKGSVTLESQIEFSGIQVTLAGTNFETYSDALGNWTLQVPVGNYAKGLEYSKEHFVSNIDLSTVTVTEQGAYTAQSKMLKQHTAELSFDLAAFGNCPSVIVQISNGVNFDANFTVDLSTESIFSQTLELDIYQATVSCSVSGWETVPLTIDLSAGQPQVKLDEIKLRQSYVTVNSGSIFTNNTRVVLSIGNDAATQMKVSDGINSTAWVDYASDQSFVMSSGDGVKTITVEFKDINGTALATVTDTINLDTTLVINSFSASGATTKGDNLLIAVDLNGEMNAEVLVSVPGLVQNLPILDNGFNGDDVANDGIYQRSLLINSTVDVNSMATVNVTDIATNVAVATSELITINTAPSISDITVTSNVATGLMTINFTTNEVATSTIEYGQNPAELEQDNNVANTLSNSHNITLSNLPKDIITYFKVTVTDAAGNSSSKYGQGKLAPAIVEGIAAYAGDNEVGVIWNTVQDSEIAGYRIYRSSDSGTSFILVNNEQLIKDYAYVDNLVSNNTEYQYKVTAVDIDGNESIASNAVSVTPTLELAGPTEIAGGVIDVNTVWLSSRSPYNISANLKIKDNVELLLLAGSQVQLSQENVSVYVDGKITAIGTEDNKVLLNAFGVKAIGAEGEESNYVESYSGNVIFKKVQELNSDQEISQFSHTVWNFLSTYQDYSNSWDRRNYYSPVTLINSTIKQKNNSNFGGFYVQSIHSSLYQNYGNSWYSSYEAPRIKSATSSKFVQLNDQGEEEITSSYMLNIGSVLNSEFNGAKFQFNNGTIEGSILTNVTASNVTTMTNSVLVNSLLIDSSNSRLTNNTFTNSSVMLSGDNSRLTMHYNTLDSGSTVSAKLLDISNNYWGSTDLTNIAAQTGYSPNKDENTHLYPILTSINLYEGDFDQDGIKDYLDYDNDNDGYSDLQEDWQSDPNFGSIYNPLDANSHPETERDNDMDGILDDADLDDDNDGLLDTDELVRLTNPYLADSDGDSVNDGDEINYKYNPLDKNNFPLMGSISGQVIDNSNSNSDGVVYIVGFEQHDEMMNYSSIQSVGLTGVTVSAGTQLMIGKDTPVYFYDSIIAGTSENVVTIRRSGAGYGSFNLYNSQVSFANIKLAMEWYIDSNSQIINSDLSMNNSGNNNGLIQGSYVSNSGYWSNNGEIAQSYLTGENVSNLSNGVIKSSYVELRGR
ncbi:carboxypeptidase regulatory-like domain-containing protein [Psychrosphaera algicola]|uniref:Carboxypeptidase regulatory-like domain-containing protein n=1 Tax=Psychrosphaera algicola TaxID=3023714 RepID=A0ABT5FB03_9GAMM|nr:carboxypeptidase regulatory-like domain-containing protein [Psychrosphaera sp. G1-22]MDC2888723.1 carboxypeptidase regulatory-like domain-containing protein [Psychrosphaera sp. G1-22]